MKMMDFVLPNEITEISQGNNGVRPGKSFPGWGHLSNSNSNRKPYDQITIECADLEEKC
jgi:hypothetical protein